VTASAIERLRELHAEYWKAAGPFKMPPNNPPASMALFDLTHHYVAVSAIALPALLECASALEAFASEYDQRREHMGHQPDDWPPFPTAYRIMVGDLRRARAALDALAKEVGT